MLKLTHRLSRGTVVLGAVTIGLAVVAGPAGAQEGRSDTGFEVRRSQAQPGQGAGASAPQRKEQNLRAGASGLGVRSADPAPQDGKRAAIERLSGVWVEGPGFEVTYGGNYDGCAQRCLANAKCVMIEYYRPERKCNLYSTMRPRLKGGSSDVGIRK